MKKTLTTILLSAASLLAADMAALNERLILDMPQEAVYGQRTTALMEASPGDDETLIWVGDGADRIAVYAKELNALADTDFETQARSFLGDYSRDGITYHITKLNDNVFYAIRQDNPEQASGADFFGIALIRHTDGSLIRLTILFAPNHITAPDKCRDWSEKALRNLRIGPGTRRLEAYCDVISFFSEMYFEVPVPEGYARTINHGCDFTYTTYCKLGKLKAPADYFGIYLGSHPDFEKPDGATSIKSTAAGKKATWYCTEPREGTFVAESCMRLTSLFSFEEAPVYMHLIIVAPSAEAREAQIQNLSHIKRVKKPTPKTKD
ncbi:MAG: hypothetical protein IKT79_06775 [Akkermansia sp.]|nr:hypothetical protein [Akkermansia sp.]